jgi:hypothetical protein
VCFNEAVEAWHGGIVGYVRLGDVEWYVCRVGDGSPCTVDFLFDGLYLGDFRRVVGSGIAKVLESGVVIFAILQSIRTHKGHV